MTTSLEKLISIGGTALSSASPKIDPGLLAPTGRAGGDLVELLGEKNGFYAFESALHVFSTHSNGSEIGLTDWNAPELWINEYRGMAGGALFFAEDIFGGQFCVKGGGIYSFDPETGRAKILSDDLEGWARAILGNYNALTGYPLGHEWQRVNGQILAGARLVPKVPFVAGGAFSVQNLFALEAVKAMHFRSNIATQINDLPDGASIKLRVID
jgi:hypothetical protein